MICPVKGSRFCNCSISASGWARVNWASVAGVANRWVIAARVGLALIVSHDRAQTVRAFGVLGQGVVEAIRVGHQQRASVGHDLSSLGVWVRPL